MSSNEQNPARPDTSRLSPRLARIISEALDTFDALVAQHGMPHQFQLTARDELGRQANEILAAYLRKLGIDVEVISVVGNHAAEGRRDG